MPQHSRKRKPKHHSTFEALPTSVLKRIILLTLSFSPDTHLEVRACHCLPSSSHTIPLRSTPTEILHDPHTNSDVRISTTSCPLDASGLGPWCCKQHLSSTPSQKHLNSALVFTCYNLYRLHRDMMTYIFCSESCLALAIKRLPYENKRLFGHVRFFDCPWELSFWTGRVSEEDYNPVDGDLGLVYVSEGSRLVRSAGVEWWVKDLWRKGTEEGERILSKRMDSKMSKKWAAEERWIEDKRPLSHKNVVW